MSDVAFPELVVGIAGPIGVDVDAISLSISSALKNLNFDSEVIKLTSAMTSYPVDLPTVDEDNFADLMNYKMSYANELCKKHKDAAFLARIAVAMVRKVRKGKTGDEDILANSFAYIVRQFKRPEEIELLRRIYGKQFILISCYGSVEARKAILESRCVHSSPTTAKGSYCSAEAEKLIERDESEGSDIGGQQLRDTFHLADVFIDGISKPEMDNKLTRFFRSFFGLNTSAPTRDEYGMYIAKAASFRSCDLSRQVGAAIFTEDGEIITQGCNEVPKPLGGAYWDLDVPDFRDVKIGFDANDDMKKELIRNFIEKLWAANMLSEEAMTAKTAKKLVDKLTKKASSSSEQDGALVSSAVMDLTEFGRAVHAEMCAICDAARIGRSTKNSVLYCTTFPCHNCAKHIVASGIKRVVFMEPYPKSKARQLHQDAIEIEGQASDKVCFVPFIGISPHRYRDIFAKSGKRKDSDGKAREWFASHNIAFPLLENSIAFYPQLEKTAIAETFGKFKTTA